MSERVSPFSANISKKFAAFAFDSQKRKKCPISERLESAMLQ